MRIHKLLKDMEDGKAIFPSIPTSVDVFSFLILLVFSLPELLSLTKLSVSKIELRQMG